MIDFNRWGNDEPTEIDFATIKAISNSNIESILMHWQPGGKIVRGEYLCGGKNGGAGESCSTNIRNGVGSDFATGEKWGDAIDLVAKIDNISNSEAAKKLSDFLSITDFTQVTPAIQTQSPEERYEAGRKIALGLWVESETCPHTHPYLIKKEVNADPGIRFHPPTGNILIPLFDESGTMWSVQRISPTGEKKINNGGRLSGNFHLIAGERDTVYICEGYATAQTVAMATGKTVVMAVSTGNLLSVGEKISKMFPSSTLIFAADNDQDKEANPGIKTATEAVKGIGRGTVIAPPFPEGQKGDWNDYALVNGGKSTRDLLLFGCRQRMFIDAKTMLLKEPEFLVEDCIETPCTGMIFGPSGSGKSFFVFDLALHCVTGKPWNNKKVKKGSVIYICGEGRHAIPRRIKAWEYHNGVEVPYNGLMVSSISIDFEPENIFNMIAEIEELAKESGSPPVMVIIDTMARALPGNADENSGKDTGLFIKECDRLQNKFDCSVIIIHHTGHMENKRARGSSALKGAMDVEMLVGKDGVIEWTKTKDIEAHNPINFNIKKVVYGEGKHDNSCVLEYNLNYDPKASKVTANMKAAITALHEAIKNDNRIDGGCMLGTWRDFYKAYLTDVSDRAKNKSFKEQVANLEERQFVGVMGNIVVPLKLQDEIITNAMFNKVLP